MKKRHIIVLVLLTVFMMSCNENKKDETSVTQIKKEVIAKDILGNPDYLAISYGGYRAETREIQPTIEELKDDLNAY